MKTLPVTKIGNPVLRKVCEPVPKEKIKDKALKEFLEVMVATMHAESGVGLAANQVGRDLQAVVLECKDNSRYPDSEDVPLQMYLNPRILAYSEETREDWEGCLSIPGYRGIVPRSKQVTFEAWTPRGEKVQKTVSGFHARVIQHEVDHIHGLFYVDRMPDLKSWMHVDELGKKLGVKIRERE